MIFSLMTKLIKEKVAEISWSVGAELAKRIMTPA